MKATAPTPHQDLLTSSTGPLHHDDGVQPERTVLSWNRTGVSLLLIALLTTRWLDDHAVSALSAAALALFAAAWTFSVQPAATGVRLLVSMSTVLPQPRRMCGP